MEKLKEDYDDYEYHLVFNTKPLSYYRTLRKNRSGSTYLTKEGKDFRRFIYREIKRQLGKDFKLYDKNVELKLMFYFDNRRKNDLDNVCKTILDGFNDVLFIDDSLINRLILEKYYDKKNPRIELFIKNNE